MPDQRRSTRWLAAAGLSATLALAASGCGGRATAPEAGSSVPAPVADSAAASASAPVVSVHVGDLSRGRRPATDVVLGRRLIHDRVAVRLTGRLPTSEHYPLAMGAYEGTPIVAAGYGSQMYTVAEDGTTARLGAEHSVYNFAPRLVVETGHLWVFYNDRGTVLTMSYELDATTGEELAVLQDTRRRDADLSGLDPADRAVVRLAASRHDPTDDLTALSPDQTTAILASTARPYSRHPRTTLAVGPVGDGAATRLRFATLVGDVAFESDTTFLVAVATTSAAVDARRTPYVVVRCTITGDCERTTRPTTRGVSISGSGPVQPG